MYKKEDIKKATKKLFESFVKNNHLHEKVMSWEKMLEVSDEGKEVDQVLEAWKAQGIEYLKFESTSDKNKKS